MSYEGSQSVEGGDRHLDYLETTLQSAPLAGTKRQLIAFANFLWTSQVAILISLMISVFVLTGNDLKLLFTPKEYDVVFDVGLVLCSIGMVVEMCLRIYKVPSYIFSAHFLMDIIVLTAVILNFSFVAEPFLKLLNPLEPHGYAVSTFSKSFSLNSIIYFRILSLIRLTHLFEPRSLLNYFLKQNKAKRIAGLIMHTWSNAVDMDTARAPTVESTLKTLSHTEKRFSKKLTDLTTHRGFIFAIILVVLVPFFTPSFYISYESSAEYGLNLMIEAATSVRMGSNVEASLSLYAEMVKSYINYHRRGGVATTSKPFNPVLFWVQLPLKIPSHLAEQFRGTAGCASHRNCVNPFLALPIEVINTLLSNEAVSAGVAIDSHIPSPDALRFNEIMYTAAVACVYDDTRAPDTQLLECSSAYRHVVTLAFDRRRALKMECIQSLGRTAFLVILFLLGAKFFDREAKRIILEPIERLIQRMEKIRKNPLAAVTIDRNEVDKAFQSDEEKAFSAAADPEFYSDSADGGRAQDPFHHTSRLLRLRKKPLPYETIVLEKAINKMLGLLALGFGEAGAGIIAKTIESSQGFNALVEGRKMNAIFGFCDIRQFTVATEILKEKVMVFVNQVADIVHGTVDEFAGSANKNIGDAFLVVWRFPEQDSDEPSLRETTANTSKLSKMADLSLIAFLKIIARIHRSPILESYELENLEVLQRISSDLRVRMGFGLHVGWAIEGAIGSKFKIDASYLSPNVNIASRLEAATKQYGVHLLVSQALYEALSPKSQGYCRQIDRVILKGSNEPLGIFTVDVDPSRLSISFTKNRPYVKSMKKQKRNQSNLQNNLNISMLFENDRDIINMRSHLNEAFYPLFRAAYANYEAGEWQVAKELLSKTHYLHGVEDGPSATLLNYMKGYDFVAPATWPGYRRLTEK